MAFQVSPGVLVQEIDLTNVVPAVATSIGAIAGAFSKGPVGEIVPIGSEGELVDIFGKPNSDNYETWFTAANFLQYGNALRVVRADTGELNATADSSGLAINNNTIYEENYSAGQGSVGNWAARTPGAWGNALGVSICASADAFEETVTATVDGAIAAGATVVSVTAGGGAEFQVGDIIYLQEASGQQYEVTAIATDDLTVRQLDNPNGGGLLTAMVGGEAIRRRWKFYDLFDAAPGTSTWAASQGLTAAVDEMHVVVYDATGDIRGYSSEVSGQRTLSVIETYAFVSKHPNARTPQGASNYYVNAVNVGSRYVYWMDHDTSGTDWGQNLTLTGASQVFVAPALPIVDTLGGGTDDQTPTVGELDLAYDAFSDAETIDINLVMAGTAPAGTDGITHATNMIDLAELRKDIVVFISPRRADVVGVTTGAAQTTNVKGFFDNLASSSYAVFDSGYKYMYDKYNDVYRYVPLNGDMAGLAANTDNVADPWFSPAGYNRGQVRGAVKLAFNPTKAQRDILYPARINPVVTFPGQGTVLFGDKTALSRPSAFDRINVRRLFIVLEKAIATAAKFQLFEFNDDFTRAQFRNLVEPFLRDVQGRRGIIDFSVVADETNNTGEVIDRNEFVADIYVKPARSINFIQLNFIAVRTGVSFSEIGG
jgi:hypothetical protein